MLDSFVSTFSASASYDEQEKTSSNRSMAKRASSILTQSLAALSAVTERCVCVGGFWLNTFFGSVAVF